MLSDPARFTLLQIVLEAVEIYNSIGLLLLIFQFSFGVYFCAIFIQKVDEYKTFKQQNTNNIDEITYEDREQQNNEQTIRVYILGVLFLAGPIALGLDVLTLFINNGSLALQYGPGFRVLILLAVQCVKNAIFKFVEVLPGVSHIILFIAGILFSFCLIGH